MKIICFSSTEKRQRHKFISTPAIELGHNVRIIKTSPILEYISALINIFKGKLSSDLSFIFGAGPTTLLAYLICNMKGIPIILRLGGDPVRSNESKAKTDFNRGKYFSWLKKRINILISIFLIKNANNITVVNNSLKNQLLSRHIIKDSCFIVPQYCPGDKKYHDYSVKDTIMILTVTNLSYKEKSNGVIKLIKLLTEFSDSCTKGIEFIVAGGGMHLSDIEHYLHNSNIPENLFVRAEGFKDNLEKLYTDADIFLYHSDHDALPNVILESKKYGLPILANNCEEFKEIIEHNVSGMLYKDNDDFFSYLRLLVGNKRKRKTMGLIAQHEFEKNYSIESVKDNLQNLIFNYYEK